MIYIILYQLFNIYQSEEFSMFNINSLLFKGRQFVIQSLGGFHVLNENSGMTSTLLTCRRGDENINPNVSPQNMKSI